MLALMRLDPKQVISSISQNAHTSLQAVKYFAQFLCADEVGRSTSLESIDAMLRDDDMNKDEMLQVIAAQMYFEAGNYKQALVIASKDYADSLPKLSLLVQVYLKLDRVDLAEKKVKAMQDLDDDDTLTRMATAWFHTAQGGHYASEAHNILQELASNFGQSVLLLNGMAVAQMLMRNFPPAFQYLKQARSLALTNKEKVHPDTLINSIVCLQHHKPGSNEIIDKIKSELQQQHPDHPWLKKQAEMDALFDRVTI